MPSCLSERSSSTVRCRSSSSISSIPKMYPVEKHKKSTSPIPDRERDIPPFMPSVVFDPILRCRYKIGDYLGKGGFAWCYTVVHEQSGSKYALKVIAKFRLKKPHHREKVLREIAIHKELRHANIVRMYSSFEDEHNIYMVLELCQLKSLVTVVRTRGRLIELEVAFYLRQLLLAVVYLQKNAKVLHRDLKLGNMLLTSNMIVKLADFGLASTMSQLQEGHDCGSVYNLHSVCGTPNYLAPEVLNRLGHSPTTESWSIGCVLFALLVGRPPFETDCMEETYQKIKDCDYQWPDHVILSSSARDLVKCLLHPDPQCRPTADQVLVHPFISSTRPIRMLPDFCLRSPVNSELRHPLTPLNRQIRNNSSCPSRNSLSWKEKSAQLSKFDQIDSSYPSSPSKCVHTRPPSNRLPSPTTNLDHRSSTSSSGSGDSGLGSADPRCPSSLENDIRKMFDHYIRMLDLITDDRGSFSARFADNSSSLYIVKWIDYTNKYGFCCQLSDGTRSVVFDDTSTLSISSDRSAFQFRCASTTVQPDRCWLAIDGCPVRMGPYVELADMFIEFMDDNLLQGGDVNHRRGRHMTAGRRLPALAHFRRTTDRIIMVLTDGTAQINFFKEKVKLVLASCSSDVHLTLIDPTRHCSSVLLSDRSSFGTSPSLEIGQLLKKYRFLLMCTNTLLKQQRRCGLEPVRSNNIVSFMSPSSPWSTAL